MIGAVIFDMDGLLVNTEEVFRDISFSVTRSMGFVISMSFYRKLLGIRSDEERKLWAEYYPDFNLAQYRDAFRQEYGRLVRAGMIHAKAGALRLLDTLQRSGVPYALATSSGLARAEETLRITGLDQYFRTIVTGEQVTRSKPDPEIFLTAAGKLGVPPSECMVLEDSVNGIKAGREAGMVVCMVPDLIPYEDGFSGCCDFVCSSLSEVSDLLVSIMHE